MSNRDTHINEIHPLRFVEDLNKNNEIKIELLRQITILLFKKKRLSVQTFAFHRLRFQTQIYLHFQ